MRGFGGQCITRASHRLSRVVLPLVGRWIYTNSDPAPALSLLTELIRWKAILSQSRSLQLIQINPAALGVAVCDLSRALRCTD